jgi:1-acyl-sn-glycerol-3-phosphate acyltransferase
MTTAGERCWQRIDQGRRAVLQLAAFGVFGLGALFLGLSSLGVRLVPGGRREVDRVQCWIHRACRLFLAGLTRAGVIAPIRDDGRFPTDGRPRLWIANHPTLMDVLLILSRTPQMDCVAKGALRRNVFLRAILRQAGYLSNADGTDVVWEAARRLKSGRSVLLFPEGTRSPKDGLGPLHRGFARIALEADCPILPLVIRCAPPVLAKGRSVHVPRERPRFTIRAGDPIPPAAPGDESLPRPIQARRLEQRVRRFFEDALDLAPADANVAPPLSHASA